MSYSVQLISKLNFVECGHHHDTVEATLKCRKALTEASNKSLLRGARLRTMWENAVIVDTDTLQVVPTPEWNPVACRKCGRIEPCQKHGADFIFRFSTNSDGTVNVAHYLHANQSWNHAGTFDTPELAKAAIEEQCDGMTYEVVE